MSILVDSQIAELLKQGVVYPAQFGAINPASLDIHVGFGLLEEIKPNPIVRLLLRLFPGLSARLKQPQWRKVDLSKYSKHRPYWLRPRQFVLLDSLETFHLPNNIAANFQLKSSAGRMGYEHALAGYCDPGWHGSKLTKEVTNIRQWRSLPIYPSMKLGQLVFYQLDQHPDKSYAETGRYNNDKVVSASKGL